MRQIWFIRIYHAMQNCRRGWCSYLLGEDASIHVPGYHISRPDTHTTCTWTMLKDYPVSEIIINLSPPPPPTHTHLHMVVLCFVFAFVFHFTCQDLFWSYLLSISIQC